MGGRGESRKGEEGGKRGKRGIQAHKEGKRKLMAWSPFLDTKGVGTCTNNHTNAWLRMAPKKKPPLLAKASKRKAQTEG